MKFKAAVKTACCTACTVYTVITVLLNLFFLTSGNTALGLDAGKALLLLLFSLIIGAAEPFRRNKTISAWVRYPVHAAVTVGAFCLCLILPSAAKAGTAFLLVVLLLLVYALIFGCAGLIGRRRADRSAKKQTPYVPQYGKGNGKDS